MNSDFHDPNNHVPPVSEDDDWDDLDKSSEVSKRSLPPKRAHRGVSEMNDGKILSTNHAEPELRIGDLKNDGEDGTSDSTDEPKKSLPSIPIKRPQRKKSVKPMAAPKDTVTRKKEVKTKPEVMGNMPVRQEERIVLPSQDTKRFHVKEIGSGETPSFPRPDPSKMSKEGLKRPRLAGGGRRWSKDAEAGGWGSKVKTGNFKWIVFSGLGAMALVVTFVLLSLSQQGEEERKSNQSYFSKIKVKEDIISEEEEIAEFEKLNKSRNRAVEIYGAYAKATELSELKGLLYNEDIILPLIGQNWKPLGYPESWVPDESSLWSALNRDGIKYGILEGKTPEYDSFKAIYRINGEDLSMDWKATVGYSTTTFEELKGGKGDGSEIRGYLSTSDFHTFSYPESAWVSYRLVSPSGDNSIWVYAGRESEVAARFSKEFATSEITGEAAGVVQVILTIEAGNDESLPNQWEIRDLVRMGWIDE
ncbi:MAG: hypothetical protein NWS80_06030 [Akkermansiaceae bacterium]|jgi:hypothetical protein|nr:hypothetical protein [Akkermansiaceae bacterium]MDP4996100.1 hypothetical protein [Akkermansiaceae bacterium]